MFPLNLGLS